MNDWDGNNRRTSDHDVLLKIDANLENFIKDFERHKKEDLEKFEKIDKRVGWVEKICYGGVAIGAFIELLWKK